MSNGKHPVRVGGITPGRWLFLLVCLAAFATMSGCATARVDWNARIGNYTYDHAVLELGPPDKYAKISDGTIVAEWLTRRGRSGTHVGMVGGWPYYGPYYYGGPAYAYSTDVSSPDYFLRLTFGPDGGLTAWKKFVR